MTNTITITVLNNWYVNKNTTRTQKYLEKYQHNSFLHRNLTSIFAISLHKNIQIDVTINYFITCF